MPQRIDANGETVRFTFEGRDVEARAGETIAAALIASGETTTRASVVSGAPRGPFCMMGVCFECLVEIDGVPNRQACMIVAEPGMTVNRQTADEVAA
ncbi:(2Fe-2S)-binding protein [Aurantimonas sp. 22II-16-19i]|uniref:(2Fe-2S)-binding protein n=1 Tax=Aurantimonas sp. 22II-16-19i TaxID=1317114 RepID=UPI0009F7FE11|nr:(2Fe-2S)-binding protein [Aurantimonas sp. 22II-16-19i]ORE94887.1 NAD(FAD)-dependent dehydrogenase [Aurantimonas sp. 22II-16-19i]